MQKLRYGVVVLWMLMCQATSASAQVNIGIGIGLPNVSIGINLPLFPDLVRVPGYPVYYAPRLDANYFFYDGMYWVYEDDNWYASSWYNGPWRLVGPEVVPLYILRIPVRYYRQPPVYFRGWRADAPPRWGEHWGREWEQHRRGWDRWKRGSVPAPAPLPVYQRQYSGDRYPRQVEQQQKLNSQKYRYQPRDKAVRQHFQQQGNPAGARSQPMPQAPPQQRGPVIREQREQRGPVFEEQRPKPGGLQREQQAPRPEGWEQRMQDRGRPQEPRGQGQEQRREEGRGR